MTMRLGRLAVAVAAASAALGTPAALAALAISAPSDHGPAPASVVICTLMADGVYFCQKYQTSE